MLYRNVLKFATLLHRGLSMFGWVIFFGVMVLLFLEDFNMLHLLK